MLERFVSVLTKYVLISSTRSNRAITIHYRFPPLLALPLHNAAPMSFILFGKWKSAVSLLEDWERRRKQLQERCRA